VWFRRIAGQAVDFYERVAEAQFLSLTEIRKEAFALERLDDLTDRVILPEAQLKESVDESAQLSIRAEIKRRAEGEEAVPDDSTRQLFEWVHGDSMLLFFRDFLDGAFFHQNDTKIANLLQGNLTLENIRINRLRLSKKELKKLGRLDLARGRGGLFGPYAWFNFITHSVAQKTARLIIDYNRFCIPMDERAVTNADDLSQFTHWIGMRRAQHEADATANEPTIDAHTDDNDIHDLAYRTTEFNALHFLDCDDVRDAAVERRFGIEVRELLELDRVHLIREIFGSYPMHAFSRERRTLNPFVFHQRYLASGRVFLFPLRLAWLAVRLSGGFLKRVAIVVRDVLNPDGAAIRKAPLADLETARRKIHRMRRPVVMETVLLRARFDGQYLGLRFTESGVPLPKEHLLESDLLRLSATEREWKGYREIKDEAEQRLRSLRRVVSEAGTPDGDLSQSADLIAASPEGRGVESVRAAVIAFLTDHRGIASLVASREQLQKLNALAQKGMLSRRWRSAFAGTAKSLMARVEAIWPHVAPEELLSDEAAKAVFTSALRTRWGQEHENVKLLQGALPDGASIATHVMGVLCGVASNPSSWSDQLVALRSVQSLGLMDLEGYEELIARLGRFVAPEPDGEVVARRL
jgi:predicted nuclease of predicted toxin-antitoxin system